MRLPVRVRSVADAEFAEGAVWYYRRSDRAAEAFISAVEATFARIDASPEAFPVAHRTIRAAIVPGFPYSVYFTIRTGLEITVCHFPPGTSKWNKIEHRLFSFIAMNWRGQPLRSLSTIVSLIGATRRRTGLHVRSELDERRYPRGIAVTDGQMAAIQLTPHPFHGEWNYTIRPTPPRRQ